MASLSKDATGNRCIQFVAGDRRRRTIRLGKVTSKVAEEVKLRVERLLSAQLSNTSVDAETSRWVAGLSRQLADRLAAVGLVAGRSSSLLGEFLADYIAGRTDVEPRTVRCLRVCAGRLTAFFGAGQALDAITPGDADEWRVWLKGRYAASTTGRSVDYARQFFRAAARKNLIVANPFADLQGGSPVNKDRQVFVSREAIARVLDACPDEEWRLVVALARYGGIRIPSELLPLTRDDLHWDRDRFRVTSPKTDHHAGKEERYTPIFPELRPYLERASARADDEDPRLFRPGNERLHVHMTLSRIIVRAGLTPWPKLFLNLRSSRETELVQQYPAHVVCAWLGHSERVAARHYLQVTEEDFRRAAESGAAGSRIALHRDADEPSDAADQRHGAA